MVRDRELRALGHLGVPGSDGKGLQCGQRRIALLMRFAGCTFGTTWEVKHWWAWVELNYRPHPYQGCALAN